VNDNALPPRRRRRRWWWWWAPHPADEQELAPADTHVKNRSGLGMSGLEKVGSPTVSRMTNVMAMNTSCSAIITINTTVRRRIVELILVIDDSV
jgi:hypothetical protein